jgi:mycothiol synthase
MTEIRIAQGLSSEDVAAVLELVKLATEEDGVAPLSEHVMLHLRSRRRPAPMSCHREQQIAGTRHRGPT